MISGLAKIEKVKKLTALAEKDLGCTVSQLALAWAAKNPRVRPRFPCLAKRNMLELD
jgi:aryl-alcohol dehydrogenase-like predicted oxidoreductase